MTIEEDFETLYRSLPEAETGFLRNPALTRIEAEFERLQYDNKALRDANANLATMAEVKRLRETMAKAYGELMATPGLFGIRRQLDFEQKATNASVILREALQ